MWKSVIQRAFTSWLKPQTQRASNQATLSKELVPYSQTEPQTSLLFTSDNHQKNEGNEKQKKETCHEHANDPYRLCSESFLETFGLVGTVCLGLKLHEFCWKSQRRLPLSSRDEDCLMPQNLKICTRIRNLLWPLAYAMHSRSLNLRQNVLEFPHESNKPIKDPGSEDSKTDDTKKEASADMVKVCEGIVDATRELFGLLENSAGTSTKDKRRAFLHFRNGASFGCSKSHFNLGICYEVGHGTKANLKKAAHHYQKASKAGHSHATYNLGVYYLEGKGGLPLDEVRGHELIDKAAGEGVVEAQTYMGIHYTEKQNWNKAVPYLQEASHKDPEAQYYLAMCYENGWGVSANYKQALQLYHEAAAVGNSDALYCLGLAYASDRPDCDKDVGLAMSFLQMAADKGHESAANHLKYLKQTEEEKQKILDCINKSSNTSRGIQAYSSVPELNHYDKDNAQVSVYQKAISRYLDIVFPSAWSKTPTKASFWIEDSHDDSGLITAVQSVPNQVVLT